MAEATLRRPGTNGREQTGAESASRGGAISIADVAEGARAVFSDVKEAGADLVNAACDGANSLFEQQRNRAADEVASLGRALRGSAQSFEQSGQGGGAAVARYAGQAAGSIDNFAETLRHRSAGEMAGDVENFARHWPLAFIASAVGLGFVASRFLMASGAHPTEPATEPAKSATPAVSGGHGAAAASGERG